MVVLARYNSMNQGVDICKILGVTGDDQKYGQGGIEFDSVKEALEYYDVKTTKDLEYLQSQNEYGHHCYLYVEDMEDVENAQNRRGPWYYLVDGRWARGSGAEKLSFTLMEQQSKSEDEERGYDGDETWDKNDPYGLDATEDDFPPFSEDEETMECPECHGYGENTDMNEPCKVCGGRGEVKVEDAEY